MSTYVSMFPKNEPAVIIFDGTSYYGLLKFDVKEAQQEDPAIEIIEEHSYWSDYMDQRIEDLNNEL